MSWVTSRHTRAAGESSQKIRYHRATAQSGGTSGCNRSSLRFERLRDGIESFEKIRLLREYAVKLPSSSFSSALAELDQALTQLTWARGSKPGGHACPPGLEPRAQVN